MSRVKKRPVRAEDSYEFHNVMQPQVSPDGRRVAYGLTSVDREQDRQVPSIWIASLDGLQTPRPFTQGVPAQSPRWSPDGRSLAYLSNRGQGWQLFVALLDGGEPRQLTHAEASSTDPAWSRSIC